MEDLLDFICIEIAEHFGFPCDNEKLKAKIHNKSLEWCETQCGKSKAAECWKKYFEIKLEEQNNV